MGLIVPSDIGSGKKAPQTPEEKEREEKKCVIISHCADKLYALERAVEELLAPVS